MSTPATGNRAADNTVTFSFDKKGPIPDEATLRAAVSAENPAAIPADEPAAAAVPAAAAAATAAEPAKAEATATPAAAADLKTHKITVDGQELEVTEADLKSGHMRHRDYTQKTQKLSAREKELDEKQAQWEEAIAQRDAELQAIDRFLRDQAAIDAYRAKAFGPAAPTQVPQIDPNTHLTPQQVADIARYNAEVARQATLRDVDSRLQEVRAQAASAQEQAQSIRRERVEREVDSHIAALVDKFPVLKRFEDIDDELMGEAAKFAPKTLDEAKTRLTEAAERRVATINALVEEGKKSAAVKAAELKKTNPEPAGGAPPKQPAGRKLTLDPKDRSARLAAAQADIEAFMQANNQLP